VLILAAYEPTIWNIQWSKGTQVLAVFASGYHRQVIAGLPKNTPTLISTYDNNGVCGYLSDSLSNVDPVSRSIYGRPVTMLYPINNASVIFGELLTPGNRWLTSTKTPPASFRNRSAPLAGQTGLEAAVRSGLLRRATPADIQAWADAVAQSSSKPDLPPGAGGDAPNLEELGFPNAYVVLRAFTYPAGLFGSNSGTFFIPKGVPKPTGDPGHSTVYDFNTLSCSGAFCSGG
jgi:hypothetical protein